MLIHIYIYRYIDIYTKLIRRNAPTQLQITWCLSFSSQNYQDLLTPGHILMSTATATSSLLAKKQQVWLSPLQEQTMLDTLNRMFFSNGYKLPRWRLTESHSGNAHPSQEFQYKHIPQHCISLLKCKTQTSPLHFIVWNAPLIQHHTHPTLCTLGLLSIAVETKCVHRAFSRTFHHQCIAFETSQTAKERGLHRKQTFLPLLSCLGCVRNAHALFPNSTCITQLVKLSALQGHSPTESRCRFLVPFPFLDGFEKCAWCAHGQHLLEGVEGQGEAWAWRAGCWLAGLGAFHSGLHCAGDGVHAVGCGLWLLLILFSVFSGAGTSRAGSGSQGWHETWPAEQISIDLSSRYRSTHPHAHPHLRMHA